MKKALIVFFTIYSLIVQSQVGPGIWQDHLSNNNCNSVAKLGNKIYASYQNGLIRFDERDKELESLNKINGLSDVGIRLLRTNPYNNKLLVIYNNCNIDVIGSDERIKNYSEFKIKSLSGKKVVNEVTFKNQFAYLACGFGIVVFDTEKMEIKDTYIIGNKATNVDVLQIALNDSLIFAASPNGMYACNYKIKSLNNFNNWKLDTINLPKGYYCGVINVANNIVCAYSPSSTEGGAKGQDTLYSYIDKWIKYPPMANEGLTSYHLFDYGNFFVIKDDYSFVVRRASDGGLQAHLNSFNGGGYYGTLRDILISKDFSSNWSYWIADNTNGLYQTYGTYPFFKQNQVLRNGTRSNLVSNIDVYNGVVAVSPSFIGAAGVGNYSREGINILKENEWKYLPIVNEKNEPYLDITSVLIDRKDPTRMWVGTWYHGVLEYRNNKFFSSKNNNNTQSMPSIIPGEPRCSGLSTDKDGNIWFAHSDQAGYLGVIKRSNNSYQNFYFAQGKFSRKTFVDRNNYVWILHEREGGITVFNHSNFSVPELDVNYKRLNKDIGSGNLESNAVYSIAQDKDGKIWVGTSAGIRVFYNPTNMFTKGADFDAQPIKIVQDGNVELLLGKELVTSIVVDGANNKWIGTANSGVYCFSPDGQQQIYHFTIDNSPLYTNSIVDLNYDETTGDIFIGTEIGLQSYRSTIIEGAEEFTEVVAYPNPVRPNFVGTVLVKGLIDNSVVKITDINGNMVWETKSTGGQIAWPVTKLSGEKVTTGVYTVYCATTDGEQKAMTKILVVN